MLHDRSRMSWAWCFLRDWTDGPLVWCATSQSTALRSWLSAARCGVFCGSRVCRLRSLRRYWCQIGVRSWCDFPTMRLTLLPNSMVYELLLMEVVSLTRDPLLLSTLSRKSGDEYTLVAARDVPQVCTEPTSNVLTRRSG